MLYYGRKSDSPVAKLTKDEENELFEKLFNGDSEARERIITSYIPLIFRVVTDCVRHYKKMDFDDVISDGTIGLIKAVDTYRLDSGFRFMSYAYACIRNEIFMTFRRIKKTPELVPLDAPVKESFDGDILCGDAIVDYAAEDDFLRLETVDILEKMHDLAWNLPDLEKKVVLLRYFSNTNEVMSQKDVAKDIGISQTYVSKVEKRAISKLREGLKEVV